MSFFKENAKAIVGVLCIVIIFPIIILTPSPIGFIPHDTGLTIIGYGGSILGGFLTLYGVWWTIKDQNKNKLLDNKKHEEEKQESLRIQYRPILTFSNEIGSPTLLFESLFICNLKIENKGRGESKNIQISIKSDDCITLIKNISKSFLTPEDSLDIEFYLTKKQEANLIPFNKSDKFTCELVFEFDDLIDTHYIQTFTCIIENTVIIPSNIKKVEDVMNTKTKTWIYRISHTSMPILKEDV